jgi:hypothetical protein
MAGRGMTSEEEEEAYAKADSSITALMDASDVERRVQCLFYQIGVTTIQKFAIFAQTGAELREILKNDFQLDATASLAVRMQVTNVMVAWDSASKRNEKRAEVEAEQEARHLPKKIQKSEFLNMITAWEAKWWKLEESEKPAKSYLEKRIEDLESGEMRAEKLNTIIHRDQDDDDGLEPMWGSDGRLKIKKSTSTTTEPENAEQLRRRLDLMMIGLQMIALRYPNKMQLQGITPQVFRSYTSYLLGEHVLELVATDTEGKVLAAPSWELVLKYEYEIRKKAYRILQDEPSKNFPAALEEAWKNPTTKERAFTTPLALQTSSVNKRSYSENWGGGGQEKLPKKDGKGKGKGGRGGKGGKGKGKGKGPQQCQSKTPDGQNICYGYNDPKTRCRNKHCHFVHCCGTCFGNHPLYACNPKIMKQPPKGGETQGGGGGAK